MVIVGVLILEGPLDLNTLEDTVAERFLAIPRFRQHIETRAGDYWWVDDPWFDRSRHIQRARLPGRGGQAELQRYIAGLASEPLDKSRPLWQIRIVEDYEGGAALVLRIHHAIGDGMALVGVMLSITDGGDRSVWTATRERRAGVRVPLPGIGLLKRGLGTGVGLWKEVAALAQNPTQAARLGAGVAGELGWLLMMPEDSPTRFKGKASGNKRVAWTDPIPLPEVKAISHALGCTLNDMLLASVAGALGEYLKAKGDETEGVEIRAFIPVDMRQSHEAGQLGNRFGLVGVELPAGIENPLARLAEVQRRMKALKQSLEPPVTLGLLEVIGHAPQIVQDRLFNMLMKRATAVMTNVPGPKEPLYLGTARISQIMFWVPQSGDIGMGVSILSFNDMVQFGLITDAAMVPDPEAIIAEFRPKFEQLLYYVLMDSWGDADERPSPIAAAAPKAKARRAKTPASDAKGQDVPPVIKEETARSRKTPKASATSRTVAPVSSPDKTAPSALARSRKRHEASPATEPALAAEATGAAPRPRRSPRAFKLDLAGAPEETPTASAALAKAKPRTRVNSADAAAETATARKASKPASGDAGSREASKGSSEAFPTSDEMRAAHAKASDRPALDRARLGAEKLIDNQNLLRRAASDLPLEAGVAAAPLTPAPSPRKPRQPVRARGGGEAPPSPAPKVTARRKLPRS